MIRINIIGTGFLDIAEGTALSFKKENQYFRFGDISLARSVEFSIPATRHNRTLLGYGDDPALYGEMLRDRHDVQVIYDGGAFRATLNVTAYEGDTFRCVLLLNTAPWIDELNKLKLSDMVSSWTKGFTFGNSYIVDANDADLYNFPNNEGVEIVRYDDGISSYLLPSVNIKAFLEDILTVRGVPHSIGVPKEYWLIMPTAKGSGVVNVTMASTGTNDLTITGASGLLDVVDVSLEYATGELFGSLIGGGTEAAKAFKALEDIEMTFPTVFPAECYLVQWSKKLKQYVTLGGVDSLGNPDSHGDSSVGSLNGKTVSLKKGYIYFFAPNPWMVDWFAPTGYVGYKDTYNPFTFAFKIARSSDLAQNEVWYIRDNMPDMTLFEFLRSVCLATGLELLVDEDGINVNVATYGEKHFKDVESVISIDSVARRVDAWGSGNRNVEVSFDSEDYVVQPIRWGYYLENSQLTDSKDVKTKFSEGGVSSNGILVEDVEAAPFKIVAKKPTIAYADGVSAYLQRIPDATMVGCDDIALESTCLRLRMLASDSKFFDLTPHDVWLWRGMAYVWTDADWSDGVMSLTLQKVSYPRVAVVPPPELTDIKAQFDQGGAVVVGTDSLDDLKQYLTVTATYSDSSTRVLADNEYTLSGTLAYPSATITVDCQGVTDTFTVAVAYDAQVAYLRAGGSQYINTAIILQEDDSVEIEAMFLNKSGDNYMMGATAYLSGEGSIWIEVYGNSTHYVRFGSSSSASQSGNASANMNVWRTYKIEKRHFYVDGVQKLTPNYSSMPSRSLVIFGRNSSTPSGGVCEIRTTKITRDNTLVIDFIPVRCGTVGYMYDRVSGTLFGNDGTGDFIVGADV